MGELERELTDVEAIELLMLIGHYEMLAMTIASLRIAPDEPRASAAPAGGPVWAGGC